MYMYVHYKKIIVEITINWLPQFRKSKTEITKKKFTNYHFLLSFFTVNMTYRRSGNFRV